MKKLSFIFCCLCIWVFVLSGCKEEVIPESKFELAKNYVEIPSEGGVVQVEYFLENPLEDLSVNYQTDCDWIASVQVLSSNLINMTILPNKAEEARNAEIEFSYGSIRRELKLRQLGTNSTLTEPFAVEIKKTEMSSVLFDIVPNDKQMTYSVIVTQKEQTGTVDDEELINQIIDYYRDMASSSSVSLQAFLKQVLVKGERKNAMFDGLKPDNEYELLILGMDYDGNVLSKIVRVGFKTQPIEKCDISFDFTFEEIKAGNIRLKVHPSNSLQRYFTYAISVEELEQGSLTIEEEAQAYIDMMLGLLTGMGGMTLDDALDKLLVQGEYVYKFGLKANKEYYAYSVAVNDLGFVCSDAGTEKFKTGEALESDNQLQLTLSNINVDRVDYEIKATNDDSYYFLMEEAYRKDGWTDEEILEDLSKYVYSGDLRSGSQIGTWKPLGSGQKYSAYLFGYDSGMPTTDLHKVEFTTLTESGDPTTFSFTSSVSDISLGKATVNVKGNPYTVLYYWDICAAFMTEEEVLESLNFYVDDLVNNSEFYQGDRGLFFKLNGSRNTDVNEYVNLPSGEYKVYAVAINEETGEFATDVLFGEEFVIDPRTVSDVTITPVYDNYFDIDELADIYGGDFNAFRGQNRFCLRLTAETSGDVKATYMAVFREDLTSESIDDIALITNLVDEKAGLTDKVCEFALPYDTDLSIIAVAEDYEGNYSKVYRELINMNKAGASDAADYKPMGVSALKNIQGRARTFRIMKNVVEKDSWADGIKHVNVTEDWLNGELKHYQKVISEKREGWFLWKP